MLDDDKVEIPKTEVEIMVISCEAPTVAELLEAYRLSFKEFAQRLQRVQSLENLNHDPAELTVASLELESARVAYYGKRDALIQELLPSAMWRTKQLRGQTRGR
jgi:hypothetical protein